MTITRYAALRLKSKGSIYRLLIANTGNTISTSVLPNSWSTTTAAGWG
jgi:hypothetical protein